MVLTNGGELSQNCMSSGFPKVSANISLYSQHFYILKTKIQLKDTQKFNSKLRENTPHLNYKTNRLSVLK
jgi:hypothetical protein